MLTLVVKIWRSYLSYVYILIFSKLTDYAIKLYLRIPNLYMYFDYTYESRNLWKLSTKIVNILLGIPKIILSSSLFAYFKIDV